VATVFSWAILFSNKVALLKETYLAFMAHSNLFFWHTSDNDYFHFNFPTFSGLVLSFNFNLGPLGY
jgi:hypothetical protein